MSSPGLWFPFGFVQSLLLKGSFSRPRSTVRLLTSSKALLTSSLASACSRVALVKDRGNGLCWRLSQALCHQRSLKGFYVINDTCLAMLDLDRRLRYRNLNVVLRTKTSPASPQIRYNEPTRLIPLRPVASRRRFSTVPLYTVN